MMTKFELPQAQVYQGKHVKANFKTKFNMLRVVY